MLCGVYWSFHFDLNAYDQTTMKSMRAHPWAWGPNLRTCNCGNLGNTIELRSTLLCHVWHLLHYHPKARRSSHLTNVMKNEKKQAKKEKTGKAIFNPIYPKANREPSHQFSSYVPNQENYRAAHADGGGGGGWSLGGGGGGPSPGGGGGGGLPAPP